MNNKISLLIRIMGIMTTFVRKIPSNLMKKLISIVKLEKKGNHLNLKVALFMMENG